VPNALSSNRDGDQEIYVMNADGSALVQLTHNPIDDVNPFWSPDGRCICFTTGQLANSAIHLVSTDGRL
jgi:TolB protein